MKMHFLGAANAVTDVVTDVVTDAGQQYRCWVGGHAAVGKASMTMAPTLS